MKSFRIALLTTAIALGASVQARADYLNGTLITGSIQFGGNPTNYYNPGNGWVPNGYLNKTQGATVGINSTSGVTEFGFADFYSIDSADFGDESLTLTTNVVGGGAGAWTQTFTDAAFQFGAIQLVSNTYVNGGLSVVLDTVNKKLTISWAGTGSAYVPTNTTYRAQFTIVDPPPVPEERSVISIVFSLGVLALGSLRLKRATG